MKHLKTKGFIAVEAVIIAAMVLLAGLSGISLFSQNGGTSLNKLETTFNIVEGGGEVEEQVSTVNLKDGTTTVTSISVSVPKILDVEILPLTAANQNITASSSNDNVATVSVDSENKRITINRVSAGTVTITVTVDGTSNMLSVTTSLYPASVYQVPWSETDKYIIFLDNGQTQAISSKHPIMSAWLPNNTSAVSLRGDNMAWSSLSGANNKRHRLVNGLWESSPMHAGGYVDSSLPNYLFYGGNLNFSQAQFLYSNHDIKTSRNNSTLFPQTPFQP